MTLQKSIGRIEKDDVRAAGVGAVGAADRQLKPSKQIAWDDARAIGNLQGRYVLAQARNRRAVNLEKRGEFGAATERFQSQTAGAGKKVIHIRPGDDRRENIEQRLLCAIGDRSRRVTLRAKQLPTSKFAGDDPHAVTVAISSKISLEY